MTAAQSTGHNPYHAVLAAIEETGNRVQRRGNTATAQCPAHPDRTPSLSINVSQDGKALLHCHAGCSTGDILEAINLPPQVLFPDYQPNPDATIVHLHHLRAWDPTKPTQPPPPPRNTSRHKTHHWDYLHPDGTPAARIVRYNEIDNDTGEIIGKTFTQHAADGNGGWEPTLNGTQVPLYNAPNIAQAITAGTPIVICEGEKDADTAIQLGLTATTNAAGAGAWQPHHTAQLAGATTVTVIADNDPPGITHALHITAQLTDIGIHAHIRLPAEGCKDLTEHVTNGHHIADLTSYDHEAEQQRKREDTRAQFPTLNWHQLWADHSEEEWILEPLLPARRLIAIYSAPKVGKSLLMLEIAQAVARGVECLGSTPTRPYNVLYVDFENDPKADTRDRLKAMQISPHQLDRLHYLSFPTMSSLDTAQGAQQLIDTVDAYDCEVVVIDTVSRAIKGDENENDTWLKFYRHTGLALKQRQVSLIRLDHTGKDETKGQRGGSAKSGDVDAVWKLSKVTDTVFRLDCDMARLPITEKTLTLHRKTIPHLHHVVDVDGAYAAFRAQVDDLVAWLDSNGIPADWGRRKLREVMKDKGRRGSDKVINDAIKQRRDLLTAWEQDNLT